MVTKPTKRRTVTTRNGRYQVSLDYVNRHALDKYDPKLDSVYWYDSPRKKEPCAAYGVRPWTYKVIDLQNPDWIIEIDTFPNEKPTATMPNGWPTGLCIRSVRITGALGITTIQLPVGELLQACCRAGAVTATYYPPGWLMPDGRTTGVGYEMHGMTDHSEIHPDDVARISGFGYNKRLGAKHPETVAQALRFANEHKSKKDKNETTQTLIDYVHERMYWYSKDSLKVALKVAYANDKNKSKKRKKQ